jgi:hypothetical protein
MEGLDRERLSYLTIRPWQRYPENRRKESTP